MEDIEKTDIDIEKSQTAQTGSSRDSFGLYGFIAALVAWVCQLLASGIETTVVEWLGLLSAVAGLVLSILGLGRRYPNLAIAGLIMSLVLLIVVSTFMIVLIYLLA